MPPAAKSASPKPGPTILASFDLPLSEEDFIITNEKPEPAAHISGSSTQATDPPKMGFNAPYNDFWAPHAKAVLEKTANSLEKENLAPPESCAVLMVEADVAYASTLQLMNPVNVAFCAFHHDDIDTVSRNQHTVKKGPEGQATSVRTDKSWSWRKRDKQDGKFTPFAILDYKRPGVIVPAKFRRGIKEISEFPKLVSNDTSMNSFDLNTRILLKQAANYSNMYDTKYVALFDWNTLVLLYMGDAREGSGGDWFYATLITDKKIMRRALLGFLERAYQASRHGEESLRPFPIPRHSTPEDPTMVLRSGTGRLTLS